MSQPIKQWSLRENTKVSTTKSSLPGKTIANPGYYRTDHRQFGELVARIEERVVWDSGIGRPRQLTLRQAVKATVMYFKTNVTEDVIGELLFVDQSTISE